MLNNQLTIYESWDLTLPKIPTRSYLYHLEPIGVGTAYVESLTGYLARLAQAHNLYPLKLILCEIAPLTQQGYAPNPAHRSIERIYGGRTCALNGTGAMATNLVQATQTLTLRDDLRFLTMLTWSEVLSQMGLLRHHQAWCPTCYEQWCRTDEVIYQPLLWSLEVVKICPQHHRRLLLRCPHCQQQLPTLAGRSRPGYCSKCGKWLGSFPQASSPDYQVWEEDELKWQTYVVSNMGDLIATAPQLVSSPTRAKITEAICAYINQVALGKVSVLARLLGISEQRLRQWCAGKSALGINKLLQITCTLETSLLDFLTKEVVWNFRQLNATPSQSQRQRQPKKLCRRTHKRINIQLVRQTLQGALEESPPPSLKELAKRIGHDRQTLRRHLPDLWNDLKTRYADYQKACRWDKIRPVLEAAVEELPPPSLMKVVKRLGYKSSYHLYKIFPKLCYDISKRYKNYRKACGVLSHEQLRQEIRLTAHQLHDAGKEPTNRSVTKLLTKPGVIRNKHAQIALKEVRCELGYEE